MIVIPQTISKKWARNNRKHYTSKGYIFTNYGDEFEVSVTDLTDGAGDQVNIICDYCGEPDKQRYSTCFNAMQGIVKKIPCDNCRSKKREETNIAIYGVSAPVQHHEVFEKMKQTNIERYGAEFPYLNEQILQKTKDGFQERFGVDFPLQHPEIREKIAHNNIEKYGVENPLILEKFKEKSKEAFREKHGVDTPFQVEEYRQKALNTMVERHGVLYSGQSEILMEKVRQTNRNKYGTDYWMQTAEFKEMSRQTSNERYGVDNPMQHPDVRQKVTESMLKNGTIPTSSQQYYIHKLIGGELNHPVGGYPLDIAFIDDKIYVEYNGGGHDLRVKIGAATEEEFKAHTAKRYKTLKAKGWKVIEINSEKDQLPSDEILVNLINQAKVYLQQGHNWIDLNIDESKLRSKTFEYNVDLGELRRL